MEGSWWVYVNEILQVIIITNIENPIFTVIMSSSSHIWLMRYNNYYVKKREKLEAKQSTLSCVFYAVLDSPD